MNRSELLLDPLVYVRSLHVRTFDGVLPPLHTLPDRAAARLLGRVDLSLQVGQLALQLQLDLMDLLLGLRLKPVLLFGPRGAASFDQALLRPHLRGLVVLDLVDAVPRFSGVFLLVL